MDLTHSFIHSCMHQEKAGSREAGVKEVEADLKEALEGMVVTLFGDVERRWVDTYFPFTDPSFELEIFYNVRAIFSCKHVAVEAPDGAAFRCPSSVRTSDAFPLSPHQRTLNK